MKSSLSGLLAELKAVLGSLATPGIRWIITSLLTFLAINNGMGLFPYVFTPSRHLLFTLPLSLILWSGFFVLASIKRPLHFLSHLVPLGTPYALIPFMVLIESIRNLIRPLTLAVRLAANIVAGHLLLTLIRSLMPSASWPVYFSVTLGLFCLLILERAVALIQAYVFTILRSLYVEEVESFSLNLSKFSYLIFY